MLSFATKHNDPNAKLGWPERIGYGAGACGFNMINGIIGSFMTVYFTNVALLDAGIIATLIAISKLFDGVSDLIVGNIVDRTESSFGKARIWLLRMVIPFAIATVLLFWVPSGFPSAVKYVYVFLMYNIVNTVCLANSISIAQFAIMFVTPFLMAKFGKRWMYAAGMGLLTLGFAGFGLFGTSKPIMIFCNVLKGCGLGISGAMAMGLVADAITYGYLKTGVNAVGMGNAGTSAAQKLGLGLGTAVFGWVMSGAGFKGEYDIQGIAQPASVETAIRFMYNWVPMVMCAIIFIIFVTSFNLDRDLKKLRAEKGIEA